MKNNNFKLLVMSSLLTIFIAGCSVQAQDHYRHSPRHDRDRGNHDKHRRDNNRYNNDRRDNNRYDDRGRSNDYHDQRN